MLTGHAQPDIRYARFSGLGRTTTAVVDNTVVNRTGTVTRIGTNQQGRYPLHLHHLHGTGDGATPRFTLVGNAITGTSSPHRWGIVVHESHAGRVERNVVARVGGSGIMLEGGAESFNTLTGNFVAVIDGTGQPIYKRNPVEFGFEGGGIWLRSPHNWVRDNVVASVLRYGYVMSVISVGPNRDGRALAPAAIGDDTPVERDFTATPPLAFSGNATYAIERGITVWEVGARVRHDGRPSIRTATAENRFDRFAAWNHAISGIEVRNASDIVFTNAAVLGDGVSKIGVDPKQRLAAHLRIESSVVAGNRLGIEVPMMAGSLEDRVGTFTVAGTRLDNTTDILISTPHSDHRSFVHLPPRRIDILNTRFGSGARIVMNAVHVGAKSLRPNVVGGDQVFVSHYDAAPGETGDSFRVFYGAQAPDAIVPQTRALATGELILLGSPVEGLSNRKSLATHGVAVGGEIAPCTDTQPAITGLVCR